MTVFSKIKREIGVFKKTSNRRLNVLTKLSMRLSKTRFSKNVRNFISHNKAIFPVSKNANNKNSPVILVSVTPMSSWHISHSYLSNILAKDNEARIVGYFSNKKPISFKGVKSNIRRILNTYPYNIYRSFGVREFIQVKPNNKDSKKVDKIYNSIVENIKTKQAVIDIKINDIPVGDLIFDSYAREHRKPTTDVSNKTFLKHLYQSIELFVYWESYFENNKVYAVVIAENVYLASIVVRIAIHNNVPAYGANFVDGVCCFSDTHMFNSEEHFSFPEEFLALPKKLRERGLLEARDSVEKRLSGKKGKDMFSESTSAYNKDLYIKSRIIRKSDKTKVLIFSHCFFDAPHFYGKTIFSDFYEWLYFLGDMSNKTDYDWYIKTHPDELPGNAGVIQEFLECYPKITLISAKSSHHQIIDEGINIALTVHGTVGFEYAALGIPVVNCSNCNPHVRYDFNLHPKSIEEYTKIIVNLESVNITVNMSQIYEYYFMRHIYYNKNDIFLNYADFLEEIGGYYSQYTPKAYGYWNGVFSIDKHNKIIDSLVSFIKSKEYCARAKTDYD